MLNSPFALPENWLFKNYLTAFKTLQVGKTGFVGMIGNSLWYSVGMTVGNVLVCSQTAYIFARYPFKGSRKIYNFLLIVMLMPIIGSGPAAYRLYSKLGLINSPLFIITNAGGIGTNFLFLEAFYRNVSWSYAEAVFIDGGGHFTAFFKIMLPQVSGALITLGILGFIGHWNVDTPILLYLPDYPTVAAGLFKVKRSMGRSGNVPAYYAGLMVTIFPVVTLYAIYAGKITKNMSVGGLKG